MPGNIEHKLFNFEITPPPGAWENIAHRLDQEFKSDEQQLAIKLFNTEATPPPSAWNHIFEGIQEKELSTARPAVIRKLFTRRIAVAAVLLGLILITAIYFFNSSNHSTEATVNPATPGSSEPRQPKDANPTSPALTQIDIPKTRVARTSTLKQRSISPEVYNYPDLDIRYAVASPLLIDNESNPTKVSAPLLRDANGRIIMDRNLLTSPGNNYIIITGPNGEQTKISRKFLSVLTDLNNEADKDEYFDIIFQRNTWKNRFQEWRNKILQNAAFAPTATNFFDILELKELLEDN